MNSTRSFFDRNRLPPLASLHFHRNYVNSKGGLLRHVRPSISDQWLSTAPIDVEVRGESTSPEAFKATKTEISSSCDGIRICPECLKKSSLTDLHHHMEQKHFDFVSPPTCPHCSNSFVDTFTRNCHVQVCQEKPIGVVAVTTD